jgi:hypothetical protein
MNDPNMGWIQTKNGQIFSNKFQLIEQKDDLVIIFATDRNFYISLNSNACKWGNQKNNIQSLICNGEWIRKPVIENALSIFKLSLFFN